jgi:hypothetical protein
MNSYDTAAMDITAAMIDARAHAAAAESAQYAAMNGFRAAIDSAMHAYAAWREYRAAAANAGMADAMADFADTARDAAAALSLFADEYEASVFLRPSDAMVSYARFNAAFIADDYARHYGKVGK